MAPDQFRTATTTAPRTTRTTRPAGRRDSRRPARSAVLAAQRLRDNRTPHHWFAQRLLVVLSGLAPVHSLLGHTSGAAYDQLVGLAPLTPLRDLRAGGPTTPTPVLEQVRGTTPSHGVIEAYARVSAGERSRALAFRLERGDDGRWRCCAVELGLEPQHAG
ncbi:Rv3235 family protein [Streptomyces sp. XM4193]|uniref:Rv3235 family protein n=1 Tax=Streptomyces sp. XM4193 TaxID=2929782 RepID=UPI001FF8EE38|nr:Rv3235 family protein [Streptomyces sp. XM4193]MCK1799155.1 Rv3235 family protein [Streptomyces sp. XM4193]